MLQRIRHSLDTNYHLFVFSIHVLINVINKRGGRCMGDPRADRAEPERIALKRETEELKGRSEQ